MAAAYIPHPISTPTRFGTTLSPRSAVKPMTHPAPAWASGMMRTLHPSNASKAARVSICSWAEDSRFLAYTFKSQVIDHPFSSFLFALCERCAAVSARLRARRNVLSALAASVGDSSAPVLSRLGLSSPAVVRDDVSHPRSPPTLRAERGTSRSRPRRR